MISRRGMLVTGASSAVIIGIGASSCAPSDGLRAVTAPWRAIGEPSGDIRLDILSYAILAPSPHNRQPWLIKLEDDELSFTLMPDTERLLPHTDPQNRQIVVGLGAFLEVMRLAAENAGYDPIFDLFPEGVDDTALDGRPIAKIRLSKGGALPVDPLFDQIPMRRTDRSVYDVKRPVQEGDLIALQKAARGDANMVGITTDLENISDLRALCYEAWEIETKTRRTHKESVDLTRIGADDIAENPDGISVSGGMVGLWKTFGILSNENLADPTSRAAKAAFSFYADAINSAMAFVWLATPDNSRASQIRAGADWVRLHLAATKAGLAFHPLSQALQEFPEMAGVFDRMHERLAVAQPGRVQGVFRLGYSKAQPPSPRWPLMTRVIQH